MPAPPPDMQPVINAPECGKEKMLILNLLQQQFDAFRVYRELLAAQRKILEENRYDDLELPVAAAEHILKKIRSLEKTLCALEREYPSESKEISGIKTEIKKIRNESFTELEQNTNLLRNDMEKTRKQIAAIRTNPYYQPEDHPSISFEF
ncbi:hypothetical protein FACS1894172_09970 [Spirochaetia bacterium]|nr:hypothetical protein FACS1894172_09970 [Spirochaetia bacterium]